MDGSSSSVLAPAMRVLKNASRVAPAEGAAAGHVTKVKLSFLDAQDIGSPPITLVCLYELPSGDAFPSVVSRLKESLAASLAVCRPLAGNLAYDEDTGDVVVDCSDDGVPFFEAELGGGGSDVRRLASCCDEALDVPTELLAMIAPEFDARILPAPVLSVQATRLGTGGGLALVMSVHHAVLDGCGTWRFFVELWSSLCRGSIDPVATKALAARCYSSREEIAAAHPRGDEVARELIKKIAPNLPVATTSEHYFGLRPGLAWRKLCHTADDIRSLRQTIDQLASSEAGGGGGGHAPPQQRVSTFVAITALYWTAFVRSKGLAPEDTAYLTFPVDLRGRLLRRPISRYYLGNCVKKCLASAGAGELLGASGLLHASRAIQAELRELAAAPLAWTDMPWAERLRHVPAGRLTAVEGSTLFPAYETADFGFGRPALVDQMPADHDGRLTLSGGRRGGEVQTSVSLDRTCMDAFVAHILATVGRSRARL